MACRAVQCATADTTLALQDFEEDEVILDEPPLAAVQDTASAEVVQACQNCFAVLGPTLEAHLGHVIHGMGLLPREGGSGGAGKTRCARGEGACGEAMRPCQSSAHTAPAFAALRSSCAGGDDEDEAGPSSSSAGPGTDLDFPVSEAVESQLQAGAVALPGSAKITLPLKVWRDKH